MALLAFCADDGHFGPVSTCRAFDFTLRFESGILSLLPNAIFEIGALGLIIFTLISRRRYVQLSTGRTACSQNRDGGSVLLAVLHLALMVTLLALADRMLPGIDTTTGLHTLLVPSLALEMFSALIIVCVLTFHRPAESTPIVTLINTFLLISSLFAAVQLRTFYFIPSARQSAFLPVFAADFGTRWLLFLTSSTKPYDPRRTAEERASFVSRIFFLYLLPSLWQGTKKPVQLEDLEPLATSYRSRGLEAKLYHEWHAAARKGDRLATAADALTTVLPDDNKSAYDVEELPMSDLDSALSAFNNKTNPISYLPKDTEAQPNLVLVSLRALDRKSVV